MSIVIKTAEEIEIMRKSCLLASSVLDMIEEYIVPGVSTEKLNQLCHDYIIEHNAIPSCLDYKGFPKSICTSVNQCVCHGIPDESVLKTGDIINVDVTVFLNEFHGDTSRTYTVGKTSRAARDLISAAKESMWEGIRRVKAGAHFGDIGYAVQSFVEAKGYSVVREYGGHGIGRKFHEDPHVVHYGREGTGPRLEKGMVFTIEPMINAGAADIILLDDGWTVETRDQKLSAQFEHTVAVTEDGVDILTLPQ